MADVMSINALRPGMVIVRITAQNGPVKIRKSGLVTSVEMIQGLAEMGVLEVEIDPAQTVEIDKPAVAKSKTQQLLDREDPSTSGFDHQLSEQFNRSLFLPSVQELPSSFQVHLKQALSVAVVILGGFALGWSGANAEKWISVFTQKDAPPMEVVTEPANSHQNAETVPTNTQQDLGDTNSNVQAEPASAEQIAAAVSSEPELAQPQLDVGMATQPQQDVPGVTEPEPLILGYRPELDDQTTQTALAEEQNQGISPELLRRFEEAVAQLDNEPQQDYTPEPENSPEVPMVHELPAWVLTELPSMAFSAHMYASSVNERWIRVNGKRVEEGQLIEDGLRLVSIEPQHVVLTYKGQTFSMAALTDW